MKNFKKDSKGITLLALVVTIIILIILATISVNILVSDNGLIQKATGTGELAKDVTEDEQVKLAVADALIAGAGKLSTENVKNALKSEFGEEKVTDETFKGEGPWTFKGERKNYEIAGGGNITELHEKTVADLKAGDWIIYESAKGDITCRVLYDTEYNNTNGTNCGVQIISSDVVGEDVTLGYTTFDVTRDIQALNSYNNAITTLNDFAKGYMSSKNDFVEDARCVGSDPEDPSKEGELVLHETTRQPCTLENQQFRDEDSNYEKDVAQMEKVGITKDGVTKNYWLASRMVDDEGELDIHYWRLDGDYDLWFDMLLDPECDNENASQITHAFRPVFKLKSGTKIVDGNGTSEKPYKMSN